MTNYTICIDGIDKTGKDTLLGFIDQLSNHKYIVNVRGIISQYSYNSIYNRPYIDYDLEPQKNIVNVMLYVDYNDWLVRCKLTNEPAIDYYEHLAIFKNTVNNLISKGCKILEFNTSELTPFAIANKIISYMETLK